MANGFDRGWGQAGRVHKLLLQFNASCLLFVIYLVMLSVSDIGITPLTGKAVNEIDRGILRSGKFRGGTKKIHEFPQENDR